MGLILYKLLMVEAFSLRESHIIVLHVQSQCCARKAPLQWLHDEKAPKGPLLFGFSNAVCACVGFDGGSVACCTCITKPLQRVQVEKFFA
jgi:hypothetical protein